MSDSNQQEKSGFWDWMCCCCISREKSQGSKGNKSLPRKKVYPNPPKPVIPPSNNRPESNSTDTFIVKPLPNGYLNCYLNASMQCLFATPQFMLALASSNNSIAKLVLQLKKDRDLDTIHRIGREVMENFGTMQCSHVFFINLLSKLCEETEAKTTFRSLFEVVVEYKLICKSCKRSIPTENRYVSLSLPLPAPTSPSSDPIDIEECFELLKKDKSLTFPCANCKDSAAVHRATIRNTSDILIIHFQRYIDGVKDERTVNFDAVFTWNGFHGKYRVYGVVYHSGTLNGGHYKAWVKTGENVWYEANDSTVTRKTAENPPCAGAYLLFCSREGLHNLQ